MIRQDLIQFIEKCNFVVSNKDDYDNIEIKDLKNDEMLVRYSKGPCFDGKNGRSVELHDNCVEVGLNNKINLRKEGLEEFVISYTIYIPSFKHNKTGFKMIFAINYVNNLVSVTIDDYEKNSEDKKMIIDIDGNDFQTYIKKIMNFLSKNNSILDDEDIQDGIKIILPLTYNEIERLVSSYDKSEEKSKI